ncbi:MAG: glycine--tRNA ligase subunit beta [Actinobacteria bacterium]|nr:glycine--tRNA ligase subunit beta [Actinomycetota bacterium]
MRENLVLEIGTEELPSQCIYEGIENLKNIIKDKLVQNRIDFSSIQTYGTPRRLVCMVYGLEEKQKPLENIVTGPPLKIAFDENGVPTKAAVGFAKSIGVSVNEIEQIETPRGIYIGKKIIEEGSPTIKVLPELLRDSILSLTFSKQMSWADYSIKFARPIRWVLALYGTKIVEFSIENLRSGNVTHGHRIVNPEPIVVGSADEYRNLLEEEGKVILDPKERKEMIIKSIENLEKNVWEGKLKVVVDKDLLDEVVNLVEIPNVLVGSFSDEFLYIPRDILIKVIQHHQRYFAIVDKNGDVVTRFVIVQNGLSDPEGKIAKGNERVLRARLSDASFFYEEDRKHTFETWFERLKGVIFFSGLGSMYDKAYRLQRLCLYILDLLTSEIKNHNEIKNPDALKEDLIRASTLCKCDLVTDMVVEFPELQGVVGREYAKERGEKKEVAQAIFEHYLPRFAGDVLPSTDVGSILSIAEKIDTICGFFLIGNVPSGSEDPFALRRKATGIVLTTIKGCYDYSLNDLIDYSLDLYLEGFESLHAKCENKENKERIIKDVYSFIVARYRFLLEREGKRQDILDAIVEAGCDSILDIDLRYKALEKFIAEDNIEKITVPMIRCKNILKGLDKTVFSSVNPDVLVDDFEKYFYSSLNKTKDILASLVEEKKYLEALHKLSLFGDTVNLFFDKVLVMDNDEKVRKNRLNVVKATIDAYLTVADFSRLVITGGEKNNKNNRVLSFG